MTEVDEKEGNERQDESSLVCVIRYLQLEPWEAYHCNDVGSAASTLSYVTAAQGLRNTKPPTQSMRRRHPIPGGVIDVVVGYDVERHRRALPALDGHAAQQRPQQLPHEEDVARLPVAFLVREVQQAVVVRVHRSSVRTADALGSAGSAGAEGGRVGKEAVTSVGIVSLPDVAGLVDSRFATTRGTVL